MADAPVTTLKMTLDEFLALPETNRIEHLIDGEYYMSPPPLDDHQRIVGNVYQVLLALTPPGTLRIAPTGVVLDEDLVEPDVFWARAGSTDCQLVNRKYWHGPPDLVVEVLSPGTADMDTGRKFRPYEQHGVREYWIINPRHEEIEVWPLAEGKFARLGLFTPEDTFTSAVLGGQTVDAAAIFAA